ncbi:hypothetical protein Hanom_Chr05g00424771 [Helianthus anomalus]
MIETWWIRRWYFLYISVSNMLSNFRTTCHVKFVILQTCGENVEPLCYVKLVECFVMCET